MGSASEDREEVLVVATWSPHSRVKPWAELVEDTFAEEVEEIREENELEAAREETSLSSFPPLVNTPEELERLTATLDTDSKPYPLMKIRRQRARLWSLLWYLGRVLLWRIFNRR